MKANLSQKEPQILNEWHGIKLNEKVFANRRNNKRFILHDGPPYANGHIHMGHALNKILKDIIVKYKTMQGYFVPYVPGWDCHGLPVEHQLFKELGLTKHEIDQFKFRKKARNYAAKYVKIQCEEFERLGIFGSWDNPYLTMNNAYEATIARLFGELYLNGYVYKGLKPIYWCASCETALAEAEVEYDNHTSPSIYVSFKITGDKTGFTNGCAPVSAVIWTTTPWTLPANLAIAVKPEFSYSLVKTDHGNFIIATDLIDDFAAKTSAGNYSIIRSTTGDQLEGIVTRHPFIDRNSPLILSDHVTLEQGTGCVHIAPGHGQEDFECGLRYGLDVYSPVNHEGRFIDTVPHFAGQNIFKANPVIIEHLKSTGALLNVENINHSYPHCWRCKQPVIFRATEQWFIGVDNNKMRDIALDTIRKVKWIPAVGENRITSMVANRPDWCLSRQRLWGVPIPVLYCAGCGKELLNEDTISRIEQVFLKESSDAWFSKSAEEIVGQQTCSECGCRSFNKEMDIIDVWFDSGVSHQAVIEQREELSFPADLYLEGSDQHRGWFQSALLTAIGCRDQAPFKTVLTHGFVVDAEGRKMSKSLGNVISPQDIISQYGVDILRLWVASVDYSGDIRISPVIIAQLADAYRRIRNTFKYLMGNLYDFNPATDMVGVEDLDELDRWALSRLHSIGLQVTEYYEKYEFYKIFHTLYNFCAVDMSAFYLDALKDRLYADAAKSLRRRSSQTVMYKITESLAKILAPLVVFTADEVWSYFRKMYPEHVQESIHLCDWPSFSKDHQDIKLEEKWSLLLELRSEVQKVLENLRKNKVIGTSLEAKVMLCASDKKAADFLRENHGALREIFIVSELVITESKTEGDWYKSEKMNTVAIYAQTAGGEKCVRCWNYSNTVDCDANFPGICERCVVAVTTEPSQQ